MIGTLSDDEIEALLASQTIGHLGCSAHGKPYVLPLAYIYEDGAIYGQTSPGMKLEMIRQNPLVCFQVEDVSDDGWRSVLLWGTLETLDMRELEGGEARRIASLLSQKLGSIQERIGIDLRFSWSEQPGTIKGHPLLFRIVVTEMTGRFYTA